VATSTREPADHTATVEIDSLLSSWRRHMTAQRMSPATLSTYSTSVGQLAAFLAERGMPTSPPDIRREHVEAFISDLLARWKPATAHNRYRGLHAFFKWAVAEGDLQSSPMDGMRPPQLPEQPVGVVRPSI
jgi:site-specific recombinase XerD